MAPEVLVVGHSQTRYFHQYHFDSSTDILCYPGYKIEDLLCERAVVSRIPKSHVSIILLYSYYIFSTKKNAYTSLPP